MLSQDQIKGYAERAEREAAEARRRGDNGTAADFDAVAARWRSQLVAGPDREGDRLFVEDGRPVGRVEAPPEPERPIAHEEPMTPGDFGFSQWAPAPPAPRMAPPPADPVMIFELPPILVPWARAARRVERPAQVPAARAATVANQPSKLRKAGAIALPLGIIVGGALVLRRVLG